MFHDWLAVVCKEEKKTEAAASFEMAEPYHPMVSYHELHKATGDFSQEIYLELEALVGCVKAILGKIKHAHGNGLNLLERLNIAIDVACALVYLHNDTETAIVHCDLKPSNILQCEDMTAKVGDFRLARLLIGRPTNQVSISSTHVLKGSIGYIPREYGWGERTSVAGDTYSFGIVLLELFSGRNPTDDGFTGGLSLTTWVQSAIPDKIVRVIDPQLLSHTFDNDLAHKGPKLQLIDCVTTILRVGLSCTADYPDGRLNVKDVVAKLKNVRDILSKLNENICSKH
ncbi:probable LRR receptor-like serine/threonine-protein kinase At3g47570 [Prosopis cineraria]|uniref:probable LRR receptor-like serine/threonine-protein kinase At3g47570 n=1 Tax=Prosopis cineraria TaxID=364024 RepID=UPI00241081FD|nr:probable LRR receptor-like serine/threonine-protein kinase At3g47570 [Prosopis cineraria]